MALLSISLTHLSQSVVQKCKNQIFPFDIFCPSNWRSDFKDVLPFKVIDNFLIKIDPICFSLIIFCSGFQFGNLLLWFSVWQELARKCYLAADSKIAQIHDSSHLPAMCYQILLLVLMANWSISKAPLQVPWTSWLAYWQTEFLLTQKQHA